MQNRSKTTPFRFFNKFTTLIGAFISLQILFAGPTFAEVSVGFQAKITSQKVTTQGPNFSIGQNELNVFGAEAGLHVAVKNAEKGRVSVRYQVTDMQDHNVDNFVIGNHQPIGAGRVRKNILIWKVTSNRVQKFNICAKQKTQSLNRDEATCYEVRVNQLAN